MSHTFNIAFRRLQLSLASRRPLQQIPAMALVHPHVSPPLRARAAPRLPLMSALSEASLHGRLASILAGSHDDSHELPEGLDYGAGLQDPFA